MTKEIKLKLTVKGDFTDKELKEYIAFCISEEGIIDTNNTFLVIGGAEIKENDISIVT